MIISIIDDSIINDDDSIDIGYFYISDDGEVAVNSNGIKECIAIRDILQEAVAECDYEINKRMSVKNSTDCKCDGAKKTCSCKSSKFNPIYTPSGIIFVTVEDEDEKSEHQRKLNEDIVDKVKKVLETIGIEKDIPSEVIYKNLSEFFNGVIADITIKK